MAEVSCVVRVEVFSTLVCIVVQTHVARYAFRDSTIIYYRST